MSLIERSSSVDCFPSVLKSKSPINEGHVKLFKLSYPIDVLITNTHFVCAFAVVHSSHHITEECVYRTQGSSTFLPLPIPCHPVVQVALSPLLSVGKFPRARYPHYLHFPCHARLHIWYLLHINGPYVYIRMYGTCRGTYVCMYENFVCNCSMHACVYIRMYVHTWVCLLCLGESFSICLNQFSLLTGSLLRIT